MYAMEVPGQVTQQMNMKLMPVQLSFQNQWAKKIVDRIYELQCRNFFSAHNNGLITGTLIALSPDLHVKLYEKLTMDQLPEEKQSKKIRDDQRKILPIGCKNFSIPELCISGTCHFNATLQGLAAALNNYPLTCNATNGASELLKKELERYKLLQESNVEKLFSIDENLIVSNCCFQELGGINGISRLQQESGDKIFFQLSIESSDIMCPDFTECGQQIVKDLHVKNHVRKRLEKKIESFCADGIVNHAPILLLKVVGEFSQKPLLFPYLNIKINNGTRQKYKLVGVNQAHNLKISKLNLFLFRQINDFFCERSITRNLLPPVWSDHVDSYVNYEDNWYVMDDENRWRVVAYENNFDKFTASKSEYSNLILHALSNAYPGCPSMLIYVPVDDEVYQQEFDDEKEYGIILTRETSKPSLLKTAGLIAGAAAGNGIFWGSLHFFLAYLLGHPEAQKSAYKCGLLFALPTALYHFFWLKSKHSSTLNYQPHDRLKSFGPQEHFFLARLLQTFR